MAHEAYIGVSGKARKVKKIYVGVGGKARNVKRGYIGVGGKARLFFKDTIEPGSVKNITSLSRAKYQMGSGELSNYAVFLGGRSNRSYYNDVEAYNSSLTKTTKSMQYKRNFMVSGGVATLSDRLITQPYCYTGGSTDIYFVSVFNNSLVESQIDPINEDDKYYTDTAVRQLGSNPISLLFSVYYDVEGNTSDAYYIYTINQNLVFSNLNENGFFYGQTAATIENGVLSAGEFINKNLVINEFSSGSDVYCTAIPTLNNVMFIENDTSDSDIRTKIINNTTLVENEDFLKERHLPMATRNIQMNYYNGSSYDQLYPQANLSNVTGSLSLNSTSGTLAISRGGTGQTTATNAMYSLISGMSTTTSVATNDYIPIQDVSVSGGRKVLVSNLINTIQNNGNGLKPTVILNSSLNLAYDNSVALDLTTNDFKNYVFVVIEVNCKTISNIDCSLRTGATDTGADKVVYMYNQYNILNSYYGSDGFIINDFLYNNTTVIKVGNRTNVTLYLKNECENNDTINHIAVYGFTV